MTVIEIDHEREVKRGEDAKYLLEHPLLIEAFDKIEASYMRAWKDSPVRDAEGREQIFRALNQLQKLKSELKTVVQTGDMAATTLKQKAARLWAGMTKG